uniref:Uncharacterized protein LOC109504895 n=1 Tax=Elaeis guineensis var. tenera TaxID=51953 RepID=A0A6J0PCV4_ELAGV|nr:uncharacterized protein LOC109504895 [Elaeis guineensis]
MESTSEMKFKSDSEQNRALDSNAILLLHPTSDRSNKRSDPVVLERELAHELAASKQATNVPSETTISSEEALERELEFRKRRKIAMLQASIDSGSLFTPSQVLPLKPSLPGIKRKAVSENLPEQETYGSEDQRFRASPNGSPIQERTKHQNNHGQSSTAQRTPSQVPSAPQFPQQIPSRTPLSSRIVTTGRKINFEFLEKEGFVIEQKIKRLSWEFLCSLDILTYPNLVWEFFGSAEFGDKTLESKV